VLTAKLDMDAKPKAAITIEFETETAAKEGLEAVKRIRPR